MLSTIEAEQKSASAVVECLEKPSEINWQQYNKLKRYSGSSMNATITTASLQSSSSLPPQKRITKTIRAIVTRRTTEAMAITTASVQTATLKSSSRMKKMTSRFDGPNEISHKFISSTCLDSKSLQNSRQRRWQCHLNAKRKIQLTHQHLIFMAAICLTTLFVERLSAVEANSEQQYYKSTTPLTRNPNERESIKNYTEQVQHSNGSSRAGDSIFMHFAKRLSTGNDLWDNVIRDCYMHPTFSCFQKNVYTYLSDALEVEDVNVTQRIKFYQNQNYYKMPKDATQSSISRDSLAVDDNGDAVEDDAAEDDIEKNEIPQTGRAATNSVHETTAETPIEEVTNALYGKSIKFAITHDIELKLPEMMFDGATFRISPRSFEGNGIIAKLELIPKQEVQARLAGKILKKKIQKFLKSKLLLSFLALLIIVKIIKVKLFWLLPLVIGVGAAKKLLLKFLLFLFPALSHLFKLCSYYQQTYHSTKYHHHHHLINHHHTIVPPWHNSGEHHHGGIPEIIYTNPPKGHISAYLNGAPIHEHYENGWENSGPGLGSEYISDINRSAQLEDNTNFFKPHPNDASELHGWGLGTTTQTSSSLSSPSSSSSSSTFSSLATAQRNQHQSVNSQQNRPPTSHINSYLNTDKESIYPSRFITQGHSQSAPNPVYVHAPPPLPPQAGRNPNHGNNNNNNRGPPFAPPSLNGLTAAQIATQYESSKINSNQLTPEVAAQLKEALRIQTEQRIIAQQQKILENQPFVQDGQPLYPKNYDPFYSPILLKIDKIVEQLGVTDDACKERLICSMYKDPSRYTPHSNFVSAELSRDTSELQPVTNTNEAIRRFYRLIQAARDGQDQRNCLQLYPNCNINTE